MAMNKVNVHMNAGSGDTSYTNNSTHQKIGIVKSLHVLDETLKHMVMTDHGFPKCFKMADLGCSSGPNTLMIISYIKEKIEALCKEKNCRHISHEFEVFLNDLPQNDFNNLFKMLPCDGGRSGMFVCGLPGSFYRRLLPRDSLNFVYSSYSLQWLSQVPEGVESNRKNIHVAMGSPAAVFKAYADQFRRDFSTFLRLRGEEMLGGGCMVLIFVGRSVADPSTKDDCQHFTILANTLVDMVSEIEEGDLHSFNFPIYTPCEQEVDSIIRDEGSFKLETIEGFRVPWDAHVADQDQSRKGEEITNFIRAYTEPVLAAHFGSSVIHHLYQSFGKKLSHHFAWR